jgi:hypothetical protein
MYNKERVHVSQPLAIYAIGKIGLMWIPHANDALTKAKLGLEWIPCVP